MAKKPTRKNIDPATLKGAATFRQTQALWKFSTECCDLKVQWAELAKKNLLSKSLASKIISAIQVWKEDPSIITRKTELQLELQKVVPGISIIRNPGDQDKRKSLKQDIDDDDDDKENDDDDDDIEIDMDEINIDGSGKGIEEMMEEAKNKMMEEPKEFVPPSRLKVFDVPKDYFKPKIFDEVANLLSYPEIINVLIPGPAGCGKSRMARELKEACGFGDIRFISFAGGMRYSQMFGSTQMKNGETYFKFAPLLQFVQIPNCLIVMEEIFGADSDCSLGLNALLEPDTRCEHTPGGVVEVADGVRFIACANTVGRQVSRQYTGAQRADDSLNDRFVPVPMSYDVSVEKHILKDVVPTEVAGYFTKTLKILRDAIRANSIPFDPSTRRLLNAIKSYNAGLNHKRAFEVSFLSTLSHAELSKIGALE